MIRNSGGRYSNLPSNRPWALEIHGQNGVGVYTENPFVRIIILCTQTIGSSKWEVGAYTEMGDYSGEYGRWCICVAYSKLLV